MNQHLLPFHTLRAACLATVAAWFSLGATAIQAQDAAIQSVPRDYALFSRTINGRKVPKFAVRVDTVVYPAQTSYRKFLTEGVPRTPEEVVARFVQLVQAPNADFDAFLALHSPEVRDAKKVERMRFNYLKFRDSARKLDSLQFKSRFDFGNFSQISMELPALGTPSAKNKDSLLFLFALLVLAATSERIGDRAYVSSSGPPGIAANLGQLAYKKTLSKDAIVLPHQLRVPGGSPALKDIHPVDVLFDGVRLDVPLDGKTRTAFPAVNFLQHAAKVIRAEEISANLGLWDAASAKKIREALGPDSTHSNYDEVEELLLDTSRRVAFVMDFDEGAVIFLRNDKPHGNTLVFERALVFKQNGVYKFSNENDSSLDMLNLDRLFRAPYFQSYLLKIAGP